jgi:hypothetical protein
MTIASCRKARDFAVALLVACVVVGCGAAMDHGGWPASSALILGLGIGFFFGQRNGIS